MAKENIYTIPNFLSFYRLLSFPFLLWMVYASKESLFAFFLCFNLITDIADGFIARRFNLQTALGARLDSLADIGTFILAFLGVFQFKFEEMESDQWWFWAFVAIFLFGHLVSFLKFKKFPSLHLYSMKISGYVQGIFFFVLFAYAYLPWLFYVAMIVGFYAWLEEIIILLKLKEMKSDVKGLYWVWKEELN